MPQIKQQQMEHIVSFQGAEVRKFVLNTIAEYVKLSELDPNALSKTLSDLKTILDLEANNVKDITGLVTANKNAITRTKQEILDVIAEMSKTQDATLKEKLNGLESSVNNMFAECATSIDTKLSAVKKELLLAESLDTFALCNIFTKSLYAYSEFICIADRKINKGTNVLTLKVSGDHFNNKAAAYDTTIGNPVISVTIDDVVVYEKPIEAVKIYNQFELLNIATDKPINNFKVTFKQDAWEGGSDVNNDGLSEDRNLYVFDALINNVRVDRNNIKYIVGTTIKDFQEVMPWQGSLVYTEQK